MTTSKPWEYKGVTVLPADRNSSGIRWCANAHVGVTLRSDTKDGMRRLISDIRRDTQGLMSTRS